MLAFSFIAVMLLGALPFMSYAADYEHGVILAQPEEVKNRLAQILTTNIRQTRA